jgi:alanyl-tRNA synthetase
MKDRTKRLYFDDPYQTQFEAAVLEKRNFAGKPAVILDQTLFYPESGGQPCDKGDINGISVINVIEDKDKIIHVLDKDIDAEKIKGTIDWETRFDHMQQHSGQHILSQVFHRYLNGKTMSFHLGKEISTVEIDIRKISEEEVEKIEKLANDIVFENREIRVAFVPDTRVDKIPLRKPPKKTGELRIVEIQDFDYTACGGTHPRRTGDIGLIKILKWERIRDNLRFEFVCGNRALKDYAMRTRVLRDVTNRFSSGESDLMDVVEKLFQDYKAQKKRNRQLQEKMSEYEAKEMINQAESRIIKKVFEDRSADEARQLALNIIRGSDHIVLFGLKLAERVHLVLACPEKTEVDLRELVSEISPIIEGKGGGRPSLVEISGSRQNRLLEALDKAYKKVMEYF